MPVDRYSDEIAEISVSTFPIFTPMSRSFQPIRIGYIVDLQSFFLRQLAANHLFTVEIYAGSQFLGRSDSLTAEYQLDFSIPKQMFGGEALRISFVDASSPGPVALCTANVLGLRSSDVG